MKDNFNNSVKDKNLPQEKLEDKAPNGTKIVNATYRLLDFFPDNDPLKNRAKDRALSILENLAIIFDGRGWISLKTILSGERANVADRLLDDIDVLEAYLKLGKYQGWISDINLLIITKEYKKIKDEIRSMGQSVVKNLEIASKFKNSAEIVEKNTINQKSVLDKENYFHQKINSSKNSGRQEKILRLIAEKDKIQVSDIIKEIPEITKRTIRRDLDNLLKRGKITRFGEFNQVFYGK